MRKLISKDLLSLLTKLLVMLVFAKFISLTLLFFLPLSSLERVGDSVGSIKYRSYRPSKLFDAQTHTSSINKEPISTALRIDSLTLHAIYGNSIEGFIVFAEKSKPNENHILALHQSYGGYKLVGIKQKSAILSKNGTNYELVFKDTGKAIPLEQRVSRALAKQLEDDTGVLRAVRKKDVMYYAKNFKAIWKNIAIKEIMRNGKIDGFRVMSVKKDSIFGQLGLAKGDVIKSVNNQKLKSYGDAFKIYHNIKDYDSLKLVIIRNKQEKELEYEIF